MVQPFFTPKLEGHCKNLLPPSDKDALSLLSSAASRTVLLTEKMRSAVVASPYSQSWCIKKHPSHPPAPSLHPKCHECSSKLTGIGKIAAQQRLCDTMVMVATENPSLGGSPSQQPECCLLNLDFPPLVLPLPWFRGALSKSCSLTASAPAQGPNVLCVTKPRSHNQYFSGSALAGLR